MPNFPSEISEIIVKRILEKHYQCPFIWKLNTGDLTDLQGNKLEVKCFSSTAPSSFGPTEKWHKLYFLDATAATSSYFKCYEINLNHQEFGRIKVNQSETFGSQAQLGRRPRLCFSQLIPQLREHELKVLFEGDLSLILQESE